MALPSAWFWGSAENRVSPILLKLPFVWRRLTADRASKCSRPTKGCWESRLGGVRKGNRTKGLGNVRVVVTCEAERCVRQAVWGSEAGMHGPHGMGTRHRARLPQNVSSKETKDNFVILNY